MRFRSFWSESLLFHAFCYPSFSPFPHLPSHTAPVSHPPLVMTEPHPMAKQRPSGSPQYQRKCLFSILPHVNSCECKFKFGALQRFIRTNAYSSVQTCHGTPHIVKSPCCMSNWEHCWSIVIVEWVVPFFCNSLYLLVHLQMLIPALSPLTSYPTGLWHAWQTVSPCTGTTLPFTWASPQSGWMSFAVTTEIRQALVAGRPCTSGSAKKVALEANVEKRPSC